MRNNWKKIILSAPFLIYAGLLCLDAVLFLVGVMPEFIRLTRELLLFTVVLLFLPFRQRVVFLNMKRAIPTLRRLFIFAITTFVVFQVSNAMQVIVGDVSVKGTAAAFYMAEFKGVVEALNTIYNSPHDANNHEFDEKKLLEILRKDKFVDANSLKNHILNNLSKQIGQTSVHDDYTLVVVGVKDLQEMIDLKAQKSDVTPVFA